MAVLNEKTTFQLEILDLWMRFGGITAVQGVSFSVRPEEIYSIIGPNGAGKTTIFNCISGIYKAQAGSIVFEGNEVLGQKPHEIAHLGIGRAFQNIELFRGMTVLDNLMSAQGYRIKYGLFRAALYMGGCLREEIESRDKVEEIIEFLYLQPVRHTAVGALSYAVYIISLLCVMRLSRLREHYSDAYSAYVTGEPRNLESALAKITYGLSLSPKAPSGVRAFYIGDPALAKQEIHEIMNKKDQYDLDHDGVLDERELELAMEKEAKSTWKTINSWFSTHPPTFRRILLLNEIEQEMQSGKYTIDRVYAQV